MTQARAGAALAISWFILFYLFIALPVILHATNSKKRNGAAFAAVKEELRALVQLGGLNLRDDVFDVLVDLTQLDVVPTAITQVRLATHPPLRV